MAQFTIGADPELFLKNQAGKYISSIGLIGGSKDFPLPIGNGCSVQEDNVAVEFNTPPCRGAKEFIEAIQYNLKVINEIASHHGLFADISASAVFDSDQLEHPQAQEFGCEPDYNAWEGGKVNPKPNAADKALRSAGGHIHIGLENGEDRIEVVKAMDLFVGCQMIKFDKDNRRRELYGMPGAYRPKPYGVEYRTASNAWITSPERIEWVYQQTEKALEFVQAGRKISDAQGELIQKCILTGDEELLAEINKEFGIV